MLVRLNTNTTSTTDKGDNYPMFVRLKTNTTSTTDKGDNYLMFVRLKTNTTSTSDKGCLLYTSPSPRDEESSRMPSSA